MNKDLMIGDIIYRPDCYDRVVEIRSNGIIGQDSNRGLIPFSELKPIEITPEILGKNGFELQPDGWLWHEFFGNKYQNYIFIQYRKGCKGVRTCELNFTNKIFLKFKPNYLHELQRVLRLCKIEKEIEL